MKTRVLLLFACLFVFAVGSGRSDSPVGIAVRVVTPHPTVCWGERMIELEAAITNNSDASVEITPQGLGYEVDLTKWDKTGRENRHHIVRDGEPENWQTLGPHQTVVIPFKEPIGDFFYGPGFYMITEGYGAYTREKGSTRFTGAINANGVIIEIIACKKNSG
jgi:hypothetical protein